MHFRTIKNSRRRGGGGGEKLDLLQQPPKTLHNVNIAKLFMDIS